VLNEAGVPSQSRQILRKEADRLKLTNTKFVEIIRKAVSKHDPRRMWRRPDRHHP